jgi:3-oxoacyl-[acyl-carrier protein] reductase
MDMIDLKEKVAIVTGGSRGIGRATCLKLSSLGANLVLNFAGNAAAAEQTKADCEALGAKVVLVQGNVAKIEDCERIFAAAQETFGRVDILVNNAGITRDALTVRMKEEDFDAVIDVNLKGTWNCMKLAAKPMMKQRSGRIINLSSIAGIIGNPGQSNYAASKAGVIGMTKTLAKEIGSRGVTVNAIAPGFIETEMTENLPEEMKEAVSKQIPLARFGQAEDVANAVAFLASDMASYISGQVIHVDGGLVV